ncbi:CGNR zinc finger domain-containing protein [Agromyces sp. ISL-38]|uniref:CGNR zinc finger domain-containing protein n=1 Tax=Agromyces sp. ISL-38 TaxID=2819107 RepID=UPI001BEB4537|nr:CGNR zinc finger domain-containing protein [Agromyces sp. ISL-38]MBT2498014.1 CGNR zinc finger domain-containing protein [Agromyces sp. ISL-38]
MPDFSLLLDLVNSRLVLGDEVSDELGDDSAASAWLKAHGHAGTRAEIADARAVREVLVPFLRGQTDATALAPWAGAMRKRAELHDGGIEWVDEVDPALAIGAKAIEEWSALQGEQGSRIRPCAAADCQHFLIDESRANARKWHSMETCGNREKARRHYARAKRGVAVS